MAAGEDEPQPVIGHGSGLQGFMLGMQQCGLSVLARPGRFATETVHGPVTGRGDDPAGRARRQACGWPAFGRDGECLLHAGQDRDRASVLRAERSLDLIGRHVRLAALP